MLDADRFLGALHPELRPPECIELRWKSPTDGGPMRRGSSRALKMPPNGPLSSARPLRRLRGRCNTPWTDWHQGRCWPHVGHLERPRRQRRTHSREPFGTATGSTFPPSIVVSTGGGLHIYHLLRRPAESSDEMHHAELVMERMSIGLDSDPVYDRSRIMRVPATYNRKRGEPRLVVLERCDPDRYNLDQLQEMAVSLPGAVDGSHASVGKGAAGGPRRTYPGGRA